MPLPLLQEREMEGEGRTIAILLCRRNSKISELLYRIRTFIKGKLGLVDMPLYFGGLIIN